jgi:2-amino-4-hydroxy-6-hydroxymethyldihydropteridine diphosphokinase
MACVYLGLGANLGDRQGNIGEALARLNESNVRMRKVSPLYETEPWGLTEQPLFLNAACSATTRYAPHVLLDLLKCVEKRMGRVDTGRYGPRPIDIDILMYDDICFDTPDLTIPHPGMISRATVLVPLADIAPQKRHPQTGLTIIEHLKRLEPVSGVTPYTPGSEAGTTGNTVDSDRSER